MSGAGRSRDRVRAVGRFRFLPRAESWPGRRAASAETSTPGMQRGPRGLAGRGCSAGGAGPRRAARGTPGRGVGGCLDLVTRERVGRGGLVAAQEAEAVLFGGKTEANGRRFLLPRL